MGTSLQERKQEINTRRQTAAQLRGRLHLGPLVAEQNARREGSPYWGRKGRSPFWGGSA